MSAKYDLRFAHHWS